MKHYKTNNGIMAIGEKGDIDGDQTHLVQEDWVEITKEEMLAITNPPKTEEELEAIRIGTINQKAGEIIESKYPIYKQLNITNLLAPYTIEDRDEMKAFIDDIRTLANNAVESKTALEDIDWTM